jgi:RNA polymerase sigma factor for flagellar operon FliA
MVTKNPNAAAADSYPSFAEREGLLLENLSEVRYIARRMHERLPSHISFDDLVHAGILGLIDAVDKFDPSRNAQLKSYARFRIRGAVLDSLRQLDWSPRNLRRQARRIEEARRDLATQFGRAPSEPEMAAQLEMPLAQFQHLLGDLRGLELASLQDPLGADGGEYAVRVVASRPEDDPFQQTCRAEVRVQLARSINELGGKERQVVALYYLKELTMKEVGAIMTIGESRVSQIHTAALIALRSAMQGRIGEACAHDADGRQPRVRSQHAKTQQAKRGGVAEDRA